MNCKTPTSQSATTHHYHTHKIHRSRTLLIEQTPQIKPQIAACFSNLAANAQVSSIGTGTQASIGTSTDPTCECTDVDGNHDYCLNDAINNSTKPLSAAFHLTGIELVETLDFSLTKRLLGAVFFLLIIYAWKQYINDEEDSDTIYI